MNLLYVYFIKTAQIAIQDLCVLSSTVHVDASARYMYRMTTCIVDSTDKEKFI